MRGFIWLPPLCVGVHIYTRLKNIYIPTQSIRTRKKCNLQTLFTRFKPRFQKRCEALSGSHRSAWESIYTQDSKIYIFQRRALELEKSVTYKPFLRGLNLASKRDVRLYLAPTALRGSPYIHKTQKYI